MVVWIGDAWIEIIEKRKLGSLSPLLLPYESARSTDFESLALWLSAHYSKLGSLSTLL